MARPFTESVLIIASHNQGKVKEMRALFAPYSIDLKAASELGLAEPEETGASFIENAELKARAASLAGGLPALADDSGLCVDALGGAPGIYSARWAGAEKDFAKAQEKLTKTLAALPPTPDGIDKGAYTAHFICALTLAWPDSHCESFEGRVSGHLTWPPRGNKGFGYDPIFIPQGSDLTFGEIDPAQKHAQSHRADAFRQFVAACLANRQRDNHVHD